MATFYSAFIISIKNLNVGDGVIKVTLVIKVCRFCKQISLMLFALSVRQYFNV